MDNAHNVTLDQEPLENTERTEDQNAILDERMEDLQAVSEQRTIGNIKYIDYLDPILNESTEEIIVIAERKSMENPDPRRLLQQQLAEEYEIQAKRWIGKIRPFISRILRRQAESEDNGDLPLSVDWDERKELIKAQKLVIRKERIAGLSERTKQVPKEIEERLAEISSDRMVTELYHVLNTNVRPAKKHFQRKSEEYHQYIKEVEQPKKFSHLDMNGPVKRYLLHRDISMGKETFPVPVYSDTPDQTFDAKEFDYTTINKLPEYGDFYAPWDWKEEEKFLICCDCTDGCMDAKKCRCRVMNEKFGNVEVLPDGRMIVSSKHEETILVSCGPKCRCIGRCEKSIYPHLPPTINKFEVFRRNDIIGFGVRTTTNIKEGAIVSEFVGEVLSKDSLDQRKDDPGHENYSLLLVNDEELDLFEKLGIREAAVESTESDLQQQKVYVDPFRFGGFSRYFSHGCYPNLSHIRVAVNDIRTPFLRIIMFANQPIVAGSELLFDYGDSHLVSSSNTKIKCQCNTILCRDEKKYLSTLDNAKRLVHFRKRIKTTREKQEEIILKAEFLLEHKRYISDFEAIHWKITNEKPSPKVDANDRFESEEEEDRNENNHPRARYLLPASLRNKLNTSTQEANILEMARKRLRASIDGTNHVDEDEEVPAKVKRSEDDWNQALKIMDRTREKHTSIKDNVQEEVHPSTSSDNANDLNSLPLPVSSAETLNDENQDAVREDVVEEDVVEDDVVERYFVEEYVDEDVVEEDVEEEYVEEEYVVRNDIKEEVVEIDEEEMSYIAHGINLALPSTSAATQYDEGEDAVEEDVMGDNVAEENVVEEDGLQTSYNAHDVNLALPSSSTATLHDEDEDVGDEDVVGDNIAEEDHLEEDEAQMSYDAQDVNVALPSSSAATLNDDENAVEEEVVGDEVVGEHVVEEDVVGANVAEEDEEEMSYNAQDINVVLPSSSAATLNDEDEEALEENVVEEDVVGDEVAEEDDVEKNEEMSNNVHNINMALPSSSTATLNDEDEDAVEKEVMGNNVVEENVVEEDGVQTGYSADDINVALPSSSAATLNGDDEDVVEEDEAHMGYNAPDINLALPSSSAATLNDKDEDDVEVDVVGDDIAEEDNVDKDEEEMSYSAHNINLALPSSSAATLDGEDEDVVVEDVVGDEVVEEDDVEEDEAHTGLSERSASPLSALSTWEMEPIASELEMEMDEDEHQEQNYQLPGSESEMEINMEEDEHQEHNDQQPDSTSEMEMDMDDDHHQRQNYQFDYQNQHFQRNQMNERMSSRTWREHSTRYHEYSSPPDSPPSSMPKSSYDRSTHGRYEAKTRRKSENSRDYGRINDHREPSLERDWDSDNDRPIYVRRGTRHPQYRNSLPMRGSMPMYPSEYRGSMPMYPSEHRELMPMYPSENRGSMPMYPSEHRGSVPMYHSEHRGSMPMYPSDHRGSMPMYPSNHRGSMPMYPSEHARANNYSTTSTYRSREMDPRYNNSYPSYRNVQEENHPSTSRHYGYDRNVPMPHNPMENRPSTSRSNIYDRYFSAPYNPDESRSNNPRRPNLATVLRAEVLDDTAEYHDGTERFSSIPLSNRPYGTQSNTTERRKSDVRKRREEEELHRRHRGNYPSRDSSPEWDSDPRYANRPISRGSEYRSSVPTRGSMHPSGYRRGSMHLSGYTRYNNGPTLPSTSAYRSREMDARYNNSYPSYRNVQEEFRASSSRSNDNRRNLPYNPKESRKNKYNSRHHKSNSSSPEYDDDEDEDRYETGMSERSASEESGSASEVDMDEDQHELSPPPPPPKKRFTHMATRGRAKVLPRRREESDVHRRPGWTQPSRESSPESDSDNKYSISMRKAKISKAPRRKSAPTPKQEPTYPSEEECSESNEEDEAPPPPSKTRKNKPKHGPRRGPRVDGRKSSSTKVKQEPTDRAPRRKSVPKQEPSCPPEEAMYSDSNEDDEATPHNDVTPSTTRSKKSKHGPRGRPKSSQLHQKIKVKQEPVERPRSRRTVDEASRLPQKVNVKQEPLDSNRKVLKGSRQARKGNGAQLSSTIAPEEEEVMSSDGEDCVPQRQIKKGRRVKRQPPMKNSKRRK